MEYFEILKRLYGNDKDQIIEVLQRSIYCSKVNKQDKSLIIVHTGFSFFTHKSKEMEILVGFSKDSNEVITIRQPRVQWNYKKIPLINGLRLIADGDYFSEIKGSMIVEVKELDNDYELFEYKVKNNSDYFENKPIKEIELLDAPIDIVKCILVEREDENPLEYPLQKRYTENIYYDGNNFFKHGANNHSGLHEDERSDKKYGYEDWLKDEFGDDASEAYWNLE